MMLANITLLFLIRSYEPTPKPKEELKFALLDDAKTQKYVPVRQTPAYQPTTPRYVCLILLMVFLVIRC